MINIIHGDATHPQTPGRNMIVHGCNDVGGWGAGFVLAIDKISPLPRIRYRHWADKGTTYCNIRGTQIPFCLGQVQLVIVKPKLAVFNLISQAGCGKRTINDLLPPARYEAIQMGLNYIKEMIYNRFRDANLHLPMIGARLGGLVFDKIYTMIEETFPTTNVNIYGFNAEDYNYLLSLQKKVLT
jgi:hypothetical protein